MATQPLSQAISIAGNASDNYTVPAGKHFVGSVIADGASYTLTIAGYSFAESSSETVINGLVISSSFAITIAAGGAGENGKMLITGYLEDN